MVRDSLASPLLTGMPKLVVKVPEFRNVESCCASSPARSAATARMAATLFMLLDMTVG